MDDEEGTGIYSTDFEIPRKWIFGIILGGLVLILVLIRS